MIDTHYSNTLPDEVLQYSTYVMSESQVKVTDTVNTTLDDE